jgi:hypothetical protein
MRYLIHALVGTALLAAFPAMPVLGQNEGMGVLHRPSESATDIARTDPVKPASKARRAPRKTDTAQQRLEARQRLAKERQERRAAERLEKERREAERLEKDRREPQRQEARPPSSSPGGGGSRGGGPMIGIGF